MERKDFVVANDGILLAIACRDVEELPTTWHLWTKQSVFRHKLLFVHWRTFWRL